MSRVAALLERLAAADPSLRLAVIAAHPDDETVGAGDLLARHPAALVVQVTPGVPRDAAATRAAGCVTRAAYGRLRRRERTAALAIAGVHAARVLELDFTDQRVAAAIPALAARLRAIAREHRLQALVTHPFEGGHPDHDAIAIAVRLACMASDPDAPALFEMTSYHADAAGGLVTGRFLPASGPVPERCVTLDAAAHDRKRRMVAAYRSQACMLGMFATGVERFRVAPAIDLSRPPQTRPLLYERWRLGLDWPRFAALANRAVRAGPRDHAAPC